jgi:hypothetical protein
MRVEQLCYRSGEGWSEASFPELDSPRTLLLVFGARSFDASREPIDELRAAYPSSLMVGCSTAGEILETALLDQSLVVLVMRFDQATLRLETARITEIGDTYQVSRQVLEPLLADQLKGVLVLSNGLSVLGSEVTRALTDILPAGVGVTGGLAGDGDRFTSTWVLSGGEMLEDGLLAVGFYGDSLEFKTAAAGGYEPFGRVTVVTSSDRGGLQELDGRPALEVITEALDLNASELMQHALLHPLEVRPDGDDGPVLIRTLLGVLEETGSLILAGDAPLGAHVRPLRSTADAVIAGATQAALQALPEQVSADGAGALLLTSCVSRRFFLGDRVDEELEAVRAAVGTPQIGFYSYGELVADATGCYVLQNQTMGVCHIYERPASE